MRPFLLLVLAVACSEAPESTAPEADPDPSGDPSLELPPTPPAEADLNEEEDFSRAPEGVLTIIEDAVMAEIEDSVPIIFNRAERARGDLYVAAILGAALEEGEVEGCPSSALEADYLVASRFTRQGQSWNLAAIAIEEFPEPSIGCEPELVLVATESVVPGMTLVSELYARQDANPAVHRFISVFQLGDEPRMASQAQLAGEAGR